MPEQVRVAVIGASSYSDMRHLPALKSHPHAEIVAICDVHRDRAEEMAAKYDIPLVFSDYREMIEKCNLHALLVVTPDDLHYPMTMDALDAGLHVLCEKPLALNAGHAREMYEKAEAVGVKHMTFFAFRWAPHYRYLRELVDEGYVGRCFQCYICLLWGVWRHLRRDQYSWKHDRKRSHGALGNLGSHMIDLVRWYVGDIAKVSAHLGTFADQPGVDGAVLDPAPDSAMLAIEFGSGAQGMIHLSMIAHTGDQGMDQRITLHGVSGTLDATATFTSAKICGARGDDEQEFRPLPIPDRVLEGVDRENPYGVRSQFAGDYLFIDSILEDRPISPSFYDGLKAQEVIDAAIESHQRGCWVSLGGVMCSKLFSTTMAP